MRIAYVGPHDAVENDDLAAAGIPVAEREAPIDVPDDVAKKLLQQPTNWQKPASKKD